MDVVIVKRGRSRTKVYVTNYGQYERAVRVEIRTCISPDHQVKRFRPSVRFVEQGLVHLESALLPQPMKLPESRAKAQNVLNFKRYVESQKVIRGMFSFLGMNFQYEIIMSPKPRASMITLH